MPKFVPIDRNTHLGKRWQQPANFSFIAKETAIPIVGAEVPNIARTMPVGFVKQGEKYYPVAVLSCIPNRNLFVASDGRWLGPVLPVQLRMYPFQALRREGSQDWIVCADEEALTNDAARGEPLFDADGTLSKRTKAVVELLGQIEKNRTATTIAVSTLAEFGLIAPWPITVKATDKEQKMDGLFRIDEAALNALDDDKYIRLRKTSALPLAYSQLISMGHLAVFQHLMKFQQVVPQTTPSLPPSLDGIFGLGNDDIVKFD